MSDTPSVGLRKLLAVCTGILVILVVASLALARAVLMPLALAVLLTFILTPPAVRLQRRGLGRLPAVMLVSILALAVVGGITALIALQLRSLAANLPGYRENISRKAAAIRHIGPGNVFENIQNALSDIHDELAGTDLATPPEQKPMPVEIHQRGTARFEAMAGPVLSVLANVVLVAVLVAFMLFTHEDLRDRLIRLVSHGRLTDTTKALEDASRRVSRFLQMQLVINIGFGLALGLGLFLIGLPQAFLWGMLVGALRFVPYLGSLFGALILVALSVAVFPGWEQPLEVFGVFLLLELSIANALEPLLIGRSTGVSPLALLIAAAFWTWLWGPVGLLLSTPLTVCLVVLGRHVPGLEFFGVLLGDEPALTPGQRYYQRLLAQDPDEAIDLVEEHLKSSPREPFYDEVLLTALVLARRDSEDGTLSSAQEQALLRDMRQILEEIVPVRCPPSGSGGAWEQTGPLVLGLPANGEGDELALSMLQQLLAAEGCRFEVLPAGMTVAEAVARVAEEQPAGICIAALPPSGLAKSRFLCKRLRAELPELGILVGRWGQKYDAEQADKRCRAAGANAVGTTLLESRVQLLSLLEETATQPRQPKPIAEEASAGASV